MVEVSKKRVSKKNKASWRKNVNIKDVENFLDDKRLEERLGLSKKKDEELFVLDTKKEQDAGVPRTKADRKIWAWQPTFHQLYVIPKSAVEDPIKRNRVKTKEERCKNQKRSNKTTIKRLNEGINQRKLFIKEQLKKKRHKNEVTFDNDIWEGDKDTGIDTTWFSENTTKQVLKSANKFTVRPPPKKITSELVAIEAPHPGLSYNPSITDHKDLLMKVAERESEMLKKEKHIQRVTSVTKVRPEYKESNWFSEMSEGLKEIKEEEEEDIKEDVNKPLSLNPPTSREKKKTIKQRKTQKRLRAEALARKANKVEKKKKSDIYKLRIMGNAITKKEVVDGKAREKRKVRLEERKKTGTKRLTRMKFEEPLDDFSSPIELTGSLRKLPVKISILKDRFNSLQRRNILQPNKLITKMKKKKVKKFVKATHRLDQPNTVNKKSVKIIPSQKTNVKKPFTVFE